MRLMLTVLLSGFLLACSGPDSQFGERVEEASFILESNQQIFSNPSGITFKELFDRNDLDLQKLDSISSSIERELRERPEDAGEAAVAYIRAIQQYIRAIDRSRRIQLETDAVQDSGPSSSEISTAIHSKDARRINRMMARSDEFQRRLKDAMERLTEVQAGLVEARSILLDRRSELAEILPASRLFPEDLLGESESESDQ